MLDRMAINLSYSDVAMAVQAEKLLSNIFRPI